MSRRFWEDLYFGDEVFIPIKNAIAYLDDPKIIFLIERLFFHYKGFALEDREEVQIFLGREPRQVYLDAMEKINEINLRRVWQIYNGKIGPYTTDIFYFHLGKIDGEVMLRSSGSTPSFDKWSNRFMAFELNPVVEVNLNKIYVKQSDLDEISKEYGVPENYFLDDQFFEPSALENNSLEIENAIIDSGELAQSLLIDFTKLVLIQHPNATTADLRRNCFEDMEDLHSRHCLKINNLLLKAGAKKSKKGEHAKDIVWESKYPRAQWERVFNKKK